MESIWLIWMLLGIVLWAVISYRRFGAVTSLVLVPSALATVTFFQVELLSVFHALTSTAIKAFWVIFAIAGFVLVFVLRVKKKPQTSLARMGLAAVRNLSAIQKVILIGLLLSWAIALFLGLVWPPNTQDVLTYHLPRVLHWLQNGTVEPFATSEPLQIAGAPLASYLQLQTVGLTGGTVYMNLVQWVAGVLTSAILAATTWILFNNKKATFAALAIAGSTPIVLSQMATSQNDLVGAFWVAEGLLIWACFRTNRFTFAMTVALTLMVVLASAGTKQTSFLLLVPVLVLLAAEIFVSAGWRKTQSWAKAVILGLAAVVGFMAAYVPQAARNLFAFGTADANLGKTLFVEEVSPLGFVLNIIRYSIVNLPVPKSIPVGQWATNFIYALGVSIDDPRFTVFSVPELVAGINRHEDSAANPFLFFLIVPLGLYGVIQKKNRAVRSLSWISLASFAFVMLTWDWTPWQSRYLLPIMLFIVPIASILLATFSKFIYGIVLTTLTLYGLVFISVQQYRPLYSIGHALHQTRVERSYYSMPWLASSGSDLKTKVDELHLAPGSVLALVDWPSRVFPEAFVWDATAGIESKQLIQIASRQSSPGPEPAPDVLVCYQNCDVDVMNRYPRAQQILVR